MCVFVVISETNYSLCVSDFVCVKLCSLCGVIVYLCVVLLITNLRSLNEFICFLLVCLHNAFFVSCSFIFIFLMVCVGAFKEYSWLHTIKLFGLSQGNPVVPTVYTYVCVRHMSFV